MCQALREQMKDEIQKDVDAARAEGIHTVVDIDRAEMGLADQTIIDKIAARFGLTSDQAKSYVMLHSV